MNALLEPYVQEGHIKGRNGVDFHLDKHRTSKILNGKADVPKQLRKVLARIGLEDQVAISFQPFIEEQLETTYFEYFVSDVLKRIGTETEADKILHEELASMSAEPGSFLAHALIASIKESNLISSAKTIWQNGTGSLSVEIGNLLDKGFGRAKKHRDIIVVPVNTAFDTEVTYGYEGLAAPLVSEKTIHGQWLVRMFKCGATSDSLKKRIEDDLGARYGTTENEWPIGTVAVVENDRATFFLIAVSAFDQKNNAHSTPELLGIALENLLRVYDECGQGANMYVPLLGTGLSRASLSHKKSYDLIRDVMLRNKDRIHGEITIMVYPKDAGNLET